MSRTMVLADDVLRRVRRDPRFRAAAEGRVPSMDWRSRGACLRFDPELFFPNAADDPAAAVAVCSTCPVQASCLAAALDAGECDGVWGGTTPYERRVMRRVWPSVVGTR
jgi:WhiB family transcriptional regulator, redox-sensing transcriptional regulator